MEEEEPFCTIMRTEAENGVESLQLPKEPKQFKLDKAKAKPQVGTKKLGPLLSTTEGREARYHGHPAPLTANTKAENWVEPRQLPKEPAQLKLDKAKPNNKTGTTPKCTIEGRGT